MPALLNCRGKDGDMCHDGRLFSNLMGSSRYLSVTRVDVSHCPAPLKRARVCAPFVPPAGWGESGRNPSSPSSLDALPDECLFEILSRVKGKRERSISACVSRKWLLILTSVRSSDVCSSAFPLNSGDSSGQPRPDLNESAQEDDYGELEEEEEEDVDRCCPPSSRCLEGREATDVRLAALAIGTVHRGGVGELLIRGTNTTRPVTDVGLGAVARASPSLKLLSLWNCPSITDEGLSQVADCCPLLEKLDLCKCPLISDKGVAAVANKCPNLSSLTVQSCHKIGAHGGAALQSLGRCCRHLRSVALVDLPHVGDRGIAGLLSSETASSSLHKIKLEHLNITDASLAVIGHYGVEVSDLTFASLPNVTEGGFWVMASARGLLKLKSLAITSCGLTDVGLKALARGCPSLKKLCLRMCIHLSDAGLMNSFAAAAAASSPPLESLVLEGCNRITLAGILGVLMNCSNSKLRSLDLTRCLGIRDVDPCPAPFRSCLSLRSLSICHCPGFGNSSLVLLGKLCPKLQHVNLSGLVRVTDAGLLPLVEGCDSGLVQVNLGGCINVRDAAVSALARRHGASLRTLNLEGCRMITDVSLLAIADCCSQLQDLDVSRCAVTDDGVAALTCATGVDLQVLSLSACSKISPRSLLHLNNLSHSLVGLNLQLCTLIGSHAIASFQRKMWHCDILS
uniref:EIN3-binding F-box protein 1 n=1 Tax=Anthurium amnicola TaxID=1678845 RepID=A0A1D1Z441_9ARAE